VAQTEDDKAHSRLEAEAAAGPRDTQALNIIIRQVEDGAYGHALTNLRALRAEAAAGPRDEGLREALVRAHEDIVTMYARHEPGWDVVHDWHADPGDIFKARAAFAAIFAKASE